MRIWSLPLDAPLTLTLAADARSADFDPDNDQIWQLSVTENEPIGIAMESTYGLRAKNMRILGAFELEGSVLHDPEDFHSAARVLIWLPSYISLISRPFPAYEVKAEYWVRSSSMLAGRFTFTNLSEAPIEPGLRLYSILQGGQNARPMSVEVLNGVRILSGRSADLEPVVFLDGGARSEPSPYPALGVNTRLAPGEAHSWIWAHSAGGLIDQDFERCRELVERNWDRDAARLIMDHSDMVMVETGNLVWDAAIWAAQREAQMLFLRPNRRLKYAVPVRSRSIKDGSSSTRAASPWEPANPWEAFYAGLQLLPFAPDWVRGYIENLLRLQDGSGSIPAMLDFAAPHEGWLHPPLLAQLVLRLFRRSEDDDFLKHTFKSLLSFYESWFSSEHDRDEDGFPEWDHVNQAGFKFWPLFSPWFQWSQGLDVSTAETVDLAVMLIMEGEALVEIARIIDHLSNLETVRSRIDRLQERLRQSWTEHAGYKHVDHYLHESVPGKRIVVRRGSFSRELNREFDPAVRVLFQVEGKQEEAHDLIVRIHSRGRRGPSRVEEYNVRKFDWFLDFGYLTSEKPSAEIEKIEVEGIDRGHKTTVWIGDYARDDIGLLLPLAAGVPSEDQADQLIGEILMDEDRYWRPGGVPSVPADDPDYASAGGPLAGKVNMLSNLWIAEGLLRYGHRKEAGELFSRLMAAIVNTLRREHAFTAHYDADIAQVVRENGSIAGLTPIALLLEILGIAWINPRKVSIEAGSPFAETIKVSWKGLQIVCEPESTLVFFPDGQATKVVGDSPQLVEQID